MGSVDKKYICGFVGMERWGGELYDTKDEAIEAGTQAITDYVNDKNNDDGNVFGVELSEQFYGEEFDVDQPIAFDLGITRTPQPPADLGNNVIDWLNESEWTDFSFAYDDTITDYVFADDDIEELNDVLKKFIERKLENSAVYIVDVIDEVNVYL